LLRNSHHTLRIFLNIALIRLSRKAAKPVGVPMAQSGIAPSGRTTIASLLYSGAIVSTS
jgi:hypothetical protein